MTRDGRTVTPAASAAPSPAIAAPPATATNATTATAAAAIAAPAAAPGGAEDRPSPARLWWLGFSAGARALRREPVLGLKRMALPVSYWRTAEFAYAWARLRREPGVRRVLDLGSPKELALHLARSHGYEVLSADITPEEVETSRRLAAALGIHGTGPGRVAAELRDGRALPYPDGAFDAACSVSVLEHIPQDGDGRALRELARVVRPGGVVVVTVPMDARYRETYVHHAVYERGYDGRRPVFFERHYDAATLRSRLLEGVPAEVVDLELWGERRLRGERLLTRLGRARALASPLEAALAALALRRVEADDPRARVMAAFLTLRVRA